ncbi:holin [Pseudoclavibacter helvolus]|uniref:Putative transporter YbjL n=1 Tax=Pseudoclavibacter helvolus TaxID=255205 RepID=A0A7W4ULN4_9MICO|nr:holin [Pseudoclavibacter helvolus]MBB2956769.1 putative transporter YbjL [Pseudoclavibacter helvolus]
MSLISEPETHGEHVERTTKLAAEQSGSTIWTAPFWRGAAERAVKTAAQVFVAAIAVSTGADLIPAVGVEGIDWLAVASVTGVATVLSVVTSIGNADFTAGR